MNERDIKHDRVAIYHGPAYRAYTTPIREGVAVPETYTSADGCVMTLYCIETIDPDTRAVA